MDHLPTRRIDWRTRLLLVDGAVRSLALQAILVASVGEFVSLFIPLPIPWTVIGVGLWVGVGNGQTASH